MVTINKSSAKLSVITSGAVPALKVMPDWVVAHLTKGFSVDGNTEAFNPAISINGTVQVGFGSRTELDRWKFGFIQIHRINKLDMFYAGKNRSDGSITIHVAESPVMAQTLCLDSEPEFTPWTHNTDFFINEGKVANFSVDHPASKAGFERGNRRTERTNFLFHLIDSRDLWTVFTALDPDGNFTHLAHVHWSLEYNFMFQWRDGKPQVKSDRCSFPNPDAFALGAPSDASLASLLAKPVPPHANEMTRKAIKLAIGGSPPNRTDHETRFGNVPGDFYR
ncbi:MAG: hypothetical protein NTW74_15100 [Acidobacteria bacterium]|nr:hypothetical protein [Acidobacteriota bacterium]